MNTVILAGLIQSKPENRNGLWLTKVRVRVESGKHNTKDIIVASNDEPDVTVGERYVFHGEVTNFKASDGSYRISIRVMPFMHGKPAMKDLEVNELAVEDDDDDPTRGMPWYGMSQAEMTEDCQMRDGSCQMDLWTGTPCLFHEQQNLT